MLLQKSDRILLSLLANAIAFYPVSSKKSDRTLKGEDAKDAKASRFANAFAKLQ